ncbi:MAG: MFS transporter [Anaerolineae bacterium]|nr:MFS transporter [Anaerolineae bacterium]
MIKSTLFTRARKTLDACSYWCHVKQLPIEDRNILYFSIDTALQGLMMGGVFTFISVFVVRLGASTLMTSLVTSLPAIVLMIFSIPAGQFVQQSKNLIRLTNLVRIFHRGSFLLVALLPFFVKTYLVEVIVAVWAIKSIASALLEASWTTVVADVIPPARRASVNGMRWAVLSLVTAGAVAVFGYMLERLPFPLSYQLVFFISFAGGLVGMGFFARMQIPENVPAEPRSRQKHALGHQWRVYAQMLADAPQFVLYEWTTFILRLAINLPAALYSIYWIRHLDASDLWIGWQATVSKLALIVGYFMWGRIVSRRGHHMPLLICTLGVGVYPVLMGLVNGQGWLPVIAIVQGFFVTGIDLAFFDTLLGICPAKNRASYIAFNTLLASLAIFIAPMIGSFLAEWMDIRLVFFLSGGLHLVAVLVFWRFRIATDCVDAPSSS